MDWIDFLRWLHILGTCVLIGTGAGIAFFMLMSNRTRDPALIAHTASIVVIADFIFTASAVVIQPVTGTLLSWEIGWSLTEGWVVTSIALYLIIGVFWIPVVFIQIRLRNEAIKAMESECELSTKYHKLYKIWFACGFPAFTSILIIVWLMISRPEISLL